MTDAVIFALLFATYIVMSRGTAGGPTGKDLFSLPHTFGETMLLLVSAAPPSASPPLRRRAGERRRGHRAGSSVTALLGLGFVAMEIQEFTGMVARRRRSRPQRLPVGLLHPGRNPRAARQPRASSASWSCSARSSFKGLTAPVSSRLFRLGLFWHFLDIVWIGIFSIVYLPGVL